MSTTKPQHQATIDITSIANRLQMQYSVSQAFKKTMLATECPHTDAQTRYNQAIEHLTRFAKDLHGDLVNHYLSPLTNIHFIDEVNTVYLTHTQALINQDNNDTTAQMLRAAYTAGREILNIYHPEYAQIPVNHTIEDAIANLNAAIYWAGKSGNDYAIKSWTDDDMKSFFIKGVTSQKNSVLKTGMVEKALERYKKSASTSVMLNGGV